MSPPQDKIENVVHLKVATVEQQVHEDVLSLLEDYIELARAGKIVSVAIVAMKSTENACYGFSAVRGKVTLLGAADMLKNLLREEIRSQCTNGLDEEDKNQPDA